MPTDANSIPPPVNRDKPMPHERDTRAEGNAPEPGERMRQAADDLKSGQVDTDQHGERGIDQAVNPENVTPTPKSTHDKK
jgi:hypothetical protein